MPIPKNLQTGLKEWATVCSALESGRQIILLRKGGISESIGGFDIEHREFLLYPTFLHQQKSMLKPSEHVHLTDVQAEPDQVKISSAGIITDIIKMPSRAAMDSLDDQHIWAQPLIDMRFNYRPMNPLFLLLVRAWRLPDAVTIESIPEYAGCKSWVPLREPIDTSDAIPALDDAKYNAARQTILDRIKSV